MKLFLMKIFWWIKPNSKSVIWAPSIKKTRLDVWLMNFKLWDQPLGMCTRHGLLIVWTEIYSEQYLYLKIMEKKYPRVFFEEYSRLWFWKSVWIRLSFLGITVWMWGYTRWPCRLPSIFYWNLGRDCLIQFSNQSCNNYCNW